jgi:hypothetical protein
MMKLLRYVSGGFAAIAITVGCGGSDSANPFIDRRPGSGGRNNASGGLGGEESGGSGGQSAASGGTSASGGSTETGGQNLGGEVPLGGDMPTGGTGTGGSEPVQTCPSDGVNPTGTFVCAPPIQLGDASNAAIGFGNLKLLSVTPDERALLWSSLGSFAERFYFAERTDTTYGFGPETALEIAERPLGLSPDGLRMILVSSDGSQLLEATRPGPGYPFDPPAVGSFALVNAWAAGGYHVFLDAVIGQDDTDLAFSTRKLTDNSQRLRVSHRAPNTDWPTGSELGGCELSQEYGERRIPTGFSPDGLTLFYYDELRDFGRAAYRTAQDAAFEWFVDVAPYSAVQVNSSCDTAYIGDPRGIGPLEMAGIGD